VDKRTEVLAVAIQAGMTVFDLEQMEAAYSPQYGSAKKPINMVGFVTAGLLRREHPQVDVEAVLAAPVGSRPFLVDVRTPQEFEAGHVPGAVNIPVDDLRSRLDQLPCNREIAVYCQVGQRGYLATRILRQAGFDAVNVSGGYKTYQLHHPRLDHASGGDLLLNPFQLAGAAARRGSVIGVGHGGQHIGAGHDPYRLVLFVDHNHAVDVGV
jgi:rhodanese-related sulfurtransferase